MHYPTDHQCKLRWLPSYRIAMKHRTPSLNRALHRLQDNQSVKALTVVLVNQSVKLKRRIVHSRTRRFWPAHRRNCRSKRGWVRRYSTWWCQKKWESKSDNLLGLGPGPETQSWRFESRPIPSTCIEGRSKVLACITSRTLHKLWWTGPIPSSLRQGPRHLRAMRRDALQESTFRRSRKKLQPLEAAASWCSGRSSHCENRLQIVSVNDNQHHQLIVHLLLRLLTVRPSNIQAQASQLWNHRLIKQRNETQSMMSSQCNHNRDLNYPASNQESMTRSKARATTGFYKDMRSFQRKSVLKIDTDGILITVVVWRGSDSANSVTDREIHWQKYRRIPLWKIWPCIRIAVKIAVIAQTSQEPTLRRYLQHAHPREWASTSLIRTRLTRGKHPISSTPTCLCSS